MCLNFRLVYQQTCLLQWWMSSNIGWPFPCQCSLSPLVDRTFIPLVFWSAPPRLHQPPHSLHETYWLHTLNARNITNARENIYYLTNRLNKTLKKKKSTRTSSKAFLWLMNSEINNDIFFHCQKILISLILQLPKDFASFALLSSALSKGYIV